MRQIAMPSLVSVQNRDLWGLGVIPSTGSGEALGNEGTVQNWRATEVGKYINWWRGVLVRCGLACCPTVTSERSVAQSRQYGCTPRRAGRCYEEFEQGAGTANTDCHIMNERQRLLRPSTNIYKK